MTLPAFERKARKVQVIDEALARWWRRLKRATGEIDKLQVQRRRLTTPRKLAPHELAAELSPAQKAAPDLAFNDSIGL